MIPPERECQRTATSARTKTMTAAATAIQVLDSGSRAAPRSIRNSSSGVLETLIKMSAQANRFDGRGQAGRGYKKCHTRDTETVTNQIQKRKAATQVMAMHGAVVVS
jgi:hypothetical protein